VVDKKAEPEEAFEPILILEDGASVAEDFEGSHSCSTCGKKVHVYETVNAGSTLGYCSVNCHIAR